MGATYGGGRVVARRGAPANERTRPAGGPRCASGRQPDRPMLPPPPEDQRVLAVATGTPPVYSEGGVAADAAGCTLLAAESARTDSHVTWLVGLGPPQLAPHTPVCKRRVKGGGGLRGRRATGAIMHEASLQSRL